MSLIATIVTFVGAIIAVFAVVILIGMGIEVSEEGDVGAQALGLALVLLACAILIGAGSAFIYSTGGVPVAVGTFTPFSSDVPTQIVASSNVGESGTVLQVNTDADTDKLFNPGSVSVTTHMGIPETKERIPAQLLVIHPGGTNSGGWFGPGEPYNPGEKVRVTIPFEHLRGGDDRTGTFRVVYVAVSDDGHVMSRSWVRVEYGR